MHGDGCFLDLLVLVLAPGLRRGLSFLRWYALPAALRAARRAARQGHQNR